MSVSTQPVHIVVKQLYNAMYPLCDPKNDMYTDVAPLHIRLEQYQHLHRSIEAVSRTIPDITDRDHQLTIDALEVITHMDMPIVSGDTALKWPRLWRAIVKRVRSVYRDLEYAGN